MKMQQLIKETMLHDGIYGEAEQKFMQVMLYDRNTRMSASILKRVKVDTKRLYFFAFGVMHFIGEKSIVEKLRLRGYRVIRIR